MMHNGRRRAALLAAVVCGLGACGSSGSGSSDAAGAKAGGAGGPLTITVADSQPPGHPSNRPLEEFSRQVDALSKGSMAVNVVTNASADAPVPGADEPVIDKVRNGGFDMAVIPARAWSTADVSSLRALQAPFLVQSDAQMDAVVRDQALVSTLFTGLDAVGVHGLTMFPESLRHLFSFTTPIMTPDDVKGRQVRYVSSADVAHLIETLGATPVDPAGEDFAAGVENGTITAADSGFTIAMGTTPRPATATGNLVLYPKMITLVANGPFWDGLTDTQRQTLSTAAATATDWAIAHRVADQAAATQYCADGGTVVLTDTQSVAAFRAATAPIYTELEDDPTTKQAIAAIDALTPTTPATAVTACTATAAATGFNADGGELPNGVYRVEMSDAFLKAHHLGDADVLDAHGVFTWRLQDGHWSFDQANDTPRGPTHGEGIYQVDGSRLLWQWDPNDGAIETFTWSADNDGALHFEEVDAVGDGDLFFIQPWTRVGDL